MKLIDKDAVLAIIEQLKDEAIDMEDKARWFLSAALARRIEALEVKEVDVDKMCEFKRCVGFAYPENASEFQKHLSCYRQGIEDVLKELKVKKGKEV